MRRAAGFTLLEVLVAFAILALSLAAVYEVFGSSARRAAQLSERAPALALAESLLAEHSVQPDYGNHTARGAEGPYRWTVTVTPQEVPPGEIEYTVPVVELRAEVVWGDRLVTRSVQLEELALAHRPTPPP